MLRLKKILQCPDVLPKSIKLKKKFKKSYFQPSTFRGYGITMGVRVAMICLSSPGIQCSAYGSLL